MIILGPFINLHPNFPTWLALDIAIAKGIGKIMIYYESWITQGAGHTAQPEGLVLRPFLNSCLFQ